MTFEVLDPWRPTILKTSFPFDWHKIKPKVENLLDRTVENTSIEKGNGKSSVSLSQFGNEDTPHTWEEFRGFVPWLHQQFHEIQKVWGVREQKLFLPKSWINVHHKGGWTDEHIHRNASIACAIYLHVPENSGRILFRDPMSYHWSSEWLNDDAPENMLKHSDVYWSPIDVKTNDVVFFPGWLPHKTEINQSDEPRYVMSINGMANVPVDFARITNRSI